jgi:broad specificity phosphatase PhoE
MKFLVITFSLLLLLASSRLYQVVSLTRHGARYHLNDFGDGAATKPLWGELTAVGMRQQQRLGQLLRKEYIDSLHLLSPQYDN